MVLVSMSNNAKKYSNTYSDTRLSSPLFFPLNSTLGSYKSKISRYPIISSTPSLHSLRKKNMWIISGELSFNFTFSGLSRYPFCVFPRHIQSSDVFMMWLSHHVNGWPYKYTSMVCYIHSTNINGAKNNIDCWN